ncbi:MAG: flagellar basal body rod protein FlgB [Armatimonadota bacterium]
MLRYVSDVTSAALERALTGEAARQRATADNLANIDTPGYRPRGVSFEDQRRAALSTDDDRVATERVAGVQPRAEVATGGALRRDGNAVDLEAEMVQLSESQVHYAAVTKLLAHKLQMLRSVATEGGK